MVTLAFWPLPISVRISWGNVEDVDIAIIITKTMTVALDALVVAHLRDYVSHLSATLEVHDDIDRQVVFDELITEQREDLLLLACYGFEVIIQLLLGTLLYRDGRLRGGKGTAFLSLSFRLVEFGHSDIHIEVDADKRTASDGLLLLRITLRLILGTRGEEEEAAEERGNSE